MKILTFGLLRKIWLVILIFIFTKGCVPGLSRTVLDIAKLNFLQIFFNAPLFIGGEVSGLEGKGFKLLLELKENSQPPIYETLDIFSNGRFQFKIKPKKGESYLVTVLQQPSQPPQFCGIAGSSGIVGDSPVQSILVQCGTSELPQPSFSPPPGEYFHPISVSILNPTALGKMYYTLDGSNPSCNPDGSGNGTEYITSISIPQPTLPGLEIRAVVCYEGQTSFIQTGFYRVTNGQLGLVTSDLTTNPPAPNYTTSQTITLSPPASPPPGTTIHYTLDGSNPNCSSPSAPNPFTIIVSSNVKAIACAPDWTASPVATFPYIIVGTVDTPSFSISTGTYTNDQTISLSVITPGASIRFAITTDGTDPSADCSSTLYTGPILVNTTNTKIQAIGCLTAWNPSPVSPIQTYTLNVANPTLSPTPPLSVPNSQTVSGSSTTIGSTFHFTTDGSNPTCASPSSPPHIIADNLEEDITVKVIACKTGYNPSSIISGIFTKTGTLAPPTYSPTPGTYTTSQTVSLNNGTGNPSGTEIRYRTDGLPATCSDTLYTTSLTVPATQTITAISCRTTPTWNPSSSVSGTYIITGTLSTPTFTPTTGTYNDIQSVTISSNPGATIYYNIGIGSDPPNPSCGSGSTTQPISVTLTDTRIRAIACLTGWDDSAIGSATFTLQPDAPVPDYPNSTIFGNTAIITFTSSIGANFRIVENSISTPPPDPSCTDPPTSATLTIPASSGVRSVKAIACRTGFAPSSQVNLVYTVNFQVPTPTLNSSLDLLNQVTANANTPPATQALCYRIGSDPDCSLTVGDSPDPLGGSCASGSTAYNHMSKPVISTTSDFRIRGCSSNHENSPVAQQTYIIHGTVGAVTASPAPGIVINDPNVTLSATHATTIFYRTDGVNPDCTGTGSITYSGPFVQPPTSLGSASIKAIGCAPGYFPSSVATIDYSYYAATPDTVSLGGTKNNDELVTITTSTSGATIRYNLNGVIPPDCSSGTLYTTSISLPNDAASPIPSLRAIACKPNYFTSSVLSRNYTFETATPIVRDDRTGSIIGASETFIAPIVVRFETSTTGGRLCLDVKPFPSTVNPTCSGALCGVGMIDLGFDTATYPYHSVSDIRTAVRVCKTHYYPNSTLTTRAFRVPSSSYLRMFVSNSSYQGNLGLPDGPISTDDKCNTDLNRPTVNAPYLALIGFSGSNGRSMTLGNPFIPLMEYRRPDNSTSILTTDNSAYPPTTITNPVSSSASVVFTGFNGGPSFTLSTNNCSDWISNSSLSFGSIGEANVSSSWINSTNSGCNASGKIYCLESRYRIWSTATTYNGNLGGLTGADAKCNDITDTNHPKSGRYKAFIVLGSRVPGGSDWIFKKNTAYYRPNRTTIIGVTNLESKLITPLSNIIGGTGFNYWTGANASMAPDLSNNCNGFTSILSGLFGNVGDKYVTSSDYYYSGNTLCVNLNPLVCVEQ